jgi:2-polyprenyl-3-methyl-5-hydroxy-6-metoxy-1,4-benzoquinol methylase
MKRRMTRYLADRLEAHVPLIAREAGLPVATVSAKQRALAGALERGASVGHATASVVDYRAPADATATALGAETIDVVFSNSVLEHVPGRVIADCFTEAMRILKPGGIMVHSVNCGDHYAYSDRSIHQLHYLQFSDEEWRRWNNAFLYQNRLRANDFITMAKDAGFTIELDTTKPSAERLAQIDAMRIAPAFAGYTREQLAVTSVDFVARKATS